MEKFTFIWAYFFVLLKWTFILVASFDGWRLSVWAPLLLRLCLPGQMQHHYTTSCVVLLGCITVFIANSKNFLMLAIRAGWCTSTWGCWVPLLKGRSDCCQSHGWKPVSLQLLCGPIYLQCYFSTDQKLLVCTIWGGSAEVCVHHHLLFIPIDFH